AEENKILNPAATAGRYVWDLFHLPDPFNGKLTLGNDNDFSWFSLAIEIGMEITLFGANNGTYVVTNMTATNLNLQKLNTPWPTSDGTFTTELTWLNNKYTASLIPKKTAKSIRDYEVGVVYSDDYAR